MEKVSSPHDKMFKESMSDIELAKDFFINYLPGDLLELIDLENISIDKDSFVENELSEYFSDILYRINLMGKEGYIYFLCEHKSYNYKKVTLQLLEYMVRIWNLKFQQKETLPVIIPIVIHHGRTEWNIGLNLSDILEDIPDKLKKYVPNFEYILYDLNVFKDSEIKGKVKLRIFLEIMKYIFNGEELKEKLTEIFKMTEELAKEDPEEEYFETLVKYILNAQEKLDRNSLVDIANEISYERGEKTMTAGERLRNEGKQEGIEIGLIEGKQEGLIEGIEGMLDIKFGQSAIELMGKIKTIHDIKKLEAIKNQIKIVKTVEELRMILN